MLIFALLLLTAFVGSIFSILVLRASTKNRLNRYIATYATFVCVWAIGDTLMLYASNLGLARLGAILFYVGPMVTALFVLFFADSSPTGKPPNKLLVIAASAITIALGGLIAIDPNFLIQSIHLQKGVRNTIIPQKTPLIIYAIYFYGYFILTYIKLIRRYRHNAGLYKTQLLFIMIGIAVSSALAITTNLTLPLRGVYDEVWMGPIFTLFFCGLLTFTIIKHRYLDIKLFAARATAYTLVLAVIAASYAGVFSVATQILLVNHSLSTQQQLLSIILALVFAATFAPLKNIFDRATNRIFYRNTYNAETLLNDLGSIMAREIELDPLINKVIDELTSAMRLSKVIILVLDHESIFYVSNAQAIEHQKISLEDLKPLGHGFVVKDTLEPDSIPDFFIKTGLNASVDLRSSNELVGYLLLGEKESGGTFNSRDTKTLSILAHELAIAIHNAKSYTQIQNFNRTLQKRIDEATIQLREANAHLEKLDGIKNEFLSMATHQLNTPLSVIDGYLSLIIDNANTRNDLPNQDREFIEKSMHRVHLMKRLVTDFLNVSRIESGTFAVEIEPIDMNRLVAEEVNTLGLAAKEQGVLLSYYPPQHPVPIIEIDDQKTRQAVMNLIDNAIYYTPKGEVKVYLSADDQNVTFKVIDNGIGVPEDQKSKLFQEFSRASNAVKQRPSGTGVGLYLVKRVIEDQGGSIIFQSTEGKGSTFGFTLPIKKEEGVELKAANSVKKISPVES